MKRATASKAKARFGRIEAIEGEVVSGWAIDQFLSRGPASLVLLVDDRLVATFTSGLHRPDLSALGRFGNEVGFRLELPDTLADGMPHRLSIRFRSGEALASDLGETDDGQVPFTCHTTTVTGQVDGMTGTSVRGWAFREDKRTGEKTGGTTLEVRANGMKVGQVKAGLARSDVADAYGCDPRCGFIYSVPHRLRDGGSFVLEFRAMPEGTALVNSPFNGRVPTRDGIDQLHRMFARMEALSSQVYAMRDELREMLSSDEHGVDDYDTWASLYLSTLRARLALERQGPRHAELLGGAKRPKVSVICPAYKPDLQEFTDAVESVTRQSWDDWELIIVDDGSGSPPLTRRIARLCAADPRIRAVAHERNQGISAATNTGVAAATGDWVAFFDHDDLLVDVALEVMLLSALNAGARAAYSDEDKVDDRGGLSEPHLKTDWNPRLLLACNYACHLLVIEAATLRELGPLRAAYDGAQDHDLLLRLSELVPARDIHHVPEILYHWRKSARSTAAAGSAKAYAVDAGRQAVLDHLARRGLPAQVEAPRGSTLYDIRWGFRAEPKVSILIPFRDQAETTRRCLERILGLTAYGNFEVVLIDNWSTQPVTAALLAQAVQDARVRVMRVEEDFNYSRLNNLAAQGLDSDFLLFMNNDVFVDQADWLRLVVNEALVDPQVGAVGVKLTYPNATVQHAGVVLGVGGVADHMFRYYPEEAVGYCFRAVCAQDMSAVTAACMLCRADAFRAVGGFDEAKLHVAFNDVDLCLRLGRAGYRIVMTPAVVAEHHESLSRGNDLSEQHLARFHGENQVMWDRWGDLIRNDPYYNPHFSRETGMFEKLSSASLALARAPSLLRRPAARAVPQPGKAHPEPVQPPAGPAEHAASHPGAKPAQRPKLATGAEVAVDRAAPAAPRPARRAGMGGVADA